MHSDESTRPRLFTSALASGLRRQERGLAAAPSCGPLSAGACLRRWAIPLPLFRFGSVNNSCGRDAQLHSEERVSASGRQTAWCAVRNAWASIAGQGVSRFERIRRHAW